MVAEAANLGNFFFNLHKCKMAMDRYRSCLILELLVPKSSVIESKCNVSFLSQGQCIALKVKECQVCRRPGASLDIRRHGFT